jgi:alpha,alpha-trehalase
MNLSAAWKLRRRPLLPLFVLAGCCWFAGLTAQAAETKSSNAAHGLSPILTYISSAWDTLTRSMTNCETVVDPKLSEASVLYLPAGFAVPAAVEEIEKRCKIRVAPLPVVITGPGQVDPNQIHAPGLLYLPNRYVVPGGRFNEMYGWDSYFIVRGLLEDGRVDLARGMVENFFFEIEHYGTILNANRTYYLTRSQPPFLTSMIRGVYEAEKAAGHEDRAWLEKAYGYASRDYELWNREAHHAGSTGLARYYDFGEGPAPESLKDETDIYRKAANYFLLHPGPAGSYLLENTGGQTAVGFEYSFELCDAAKTVAKPGCEPARTVSLSPDYYKGDRAMRESGFDISFRFGPFGAETHHYAPVCLNSLLYKSEKDLEWMSAVLDRSDNAERWRARADERKARIQQRLWDRQRGLFFDYNFETGQRSTYEYISSFYPLWAALATPEQAQALARNLRILEQPGGLAMSTTDAGDQWDYPYGWAPTQMIALEGLRNYGFHDDANRISYNFLSMIAENFRRDHTLREKYNVVTRSSESHIAAGYNQNVIGFGWTNAAFLVFLHELPQEWAERLGREQATAAASR